MSKPALPKHFEPYKLADQSANFAGKLPVSAFTRLSEALVGQEGEIEIDLEFGRGEDGFRELRGVVKGEVQVECQRCLQAMPFELEANIHLGFAFHEDMAKSMPKYLDPIVLSPDERITTVDLLEDDLILCVPEFVSHEPGQCTIKTEFKGSDDSVEEPRKDNPFQVLAELKSEKKEH